MLNKAFTKDCSKCHFMKISEVGKSICHWGKSKKNKELMIPKGKKVLKCNLKR